MSLNLHDVSRIAAQASAHVDNPRAQEYIERELLHHVILEPLLQTKSSKVLTFQGGTALRLCYGSPRFSEDLDFICGTETSSFDIAEFSSAIESSLKLQYGLDVSLKKPSPDILLSAKPDSMAVPKWFGKFNLTPSRPDLPLQKVKIEVAPVPAYTCSYMQPINHYVSYDFKSKLPAIRVETIDEIMADKMIALSMASYPRYRDIWDMAWIAQNPNYTRTSLSFLSRKACDYKISDISNRLESKLKELPSLIESSGYYTAMRRLLPYDVFHATVGDSSTKEKALEAIIGIFTPAIEYLNNPSHPSLHNKEKDILFVAANSDNKLQRDSALRNVESSSMHFECTK